MGGSAENDAAIGDRLGPAIAKDQVADVIGRIMDVYVENRNEDERFLETYRRIGIKPFKQRVYSESREEETEVQAVAGY